MKVSMSPWVSQLDKERPSVKFSHDSETDIAVVGAGIAGVSTAFFILKNTQQKVILIEAGRLAHGATGHNAGQIVSYFERPFKDMVKEFGVEKAAHAWSAVESAWMLLMTMYTDADLTIPLDRFTGHAGFSSEKQVLEFLEDAYERKNAHLNIEEVIIANDAPFLARVPDKYGEIFKTAPRDEILSRLETKNPSFIACASYQKGTTNSALFCQEIVDYLLSKYKGRFSLYENSPVKKVVLKKDHALLDADVATLIAKRVVLCTNGFEHFSIFNESGLDIDTRFHHLVKGVVGYMSGYLEDYTKPPTAISYFTDPDATEVDPYIYLTRREYRTGDDARKNLICIGGPEHDLEDREKYIGDYEYPEEAQKQIDDFVHSTYLDPSKKDSEVEYQFTWHGLMGYTPNGVRLIGAEPKNPILLYNLGCNGVGILPSVYGGFRISQILRGDKLDPTIFDPRE